MSGKLILQHQDQHRVEKEETTIPLVPEIDQEIETLGAMKRWFCLLILINYAIAVKSATFH
jgi:hypothetical protein